MKTIGLIGGTTWYSTVEYYRLINETVNKRHGDNTSAKILLYSVNFGEIEFLTERQDWDAIAEILTDAAKRLEMAGADCLLLCANTMHLNAARVQEAINIPLIHIADVTVKVIKEQKLAGVLLLGTRYTMMADFYPELLDKEGIKLFIPGAEDRDWINSTIYNELGKGVILEETQKKYLHIIQKFIPDGVQGVILGCTEIPLLIKPGDCSLPLFNTTYLHATAAVDFALNDR